MKEMNNLVPIGPELNLDPDIVARTNPDLLQPVPTKPAEVDVKRMMDALQFGCPDLLKNLISMLNSAGIYGPVKMHDYLNEFLRIYDTCTEALPAVEKRFNCKYCRAYPNSSPACANCKAADTDSKDETTEPMEILSAEQVIAEEADTKKLMDAFVGKASGLLKDLLFMYDTHGLNGLRYVHKYLTYFRDIYGHNGPNQDQCGKCDCRMAYIYEC